MENIPASYLVTDEEGTDRFICNINALTESELKAEGFDTFGDVQIMDEFKIIQEIIDESHELRAEVIQFALKFMKEDSRLTPAMAMNLGFNEWVK